MQRCGYKLWAALILSVAASVVYMSALMAAEDEKHKPFTLALKTSGEVVAVAMEVKQKLAAAGFDVVGEYFPYANKTAVIIVVTSDALKKAAAKTEFGGYGAAQRVSVTKVNDEIQVAYANPLYWSAAYRMQVDLSALSEKLANTLGKVADFGSEEGLSAKVLAKYQYMFGMEYFDDPSELAEFSSYQEAVNAVESGLAAARGGVTKVYRIDIPGKEQTVFGVAINNAVECSGDAFIMNNIDFKPLRSTVHLPYEILVSDDEVYALYARFRIAISFPDLSMIGANSFMSIMCAPSAIEGALEAVVKK